MKWLITIITAALTTTGCMLETPDPCDSSPVACDSAPVIKEPVPDTPRMDATPGVESISVSWSGSTRAEAYFLYHNTSSPVGTANRIDLADVSSYQFKDLDPSKKYYFSVVGYNKTGPSSMSSEASATPVPLAPATISATTGAGSNSISWASSRGAAGGYTLYYSTSTPVTTKDNAFAVSGTSYTHTGLAGGTPIYYAVSAYNAGGNSALSSETSSTPVPAKPTGIAAVAGIEENTISWNAVAGATGYTLHYSESTPVTTSDSSFNVGGTSYKHTSLDAAKTYYYAVIADGSTGSSPLSAEASAQPIPGAPTLTVGTSTDTTVTVNWNTVSGADGYRLYKSSSSPVTTSDTAVVGGGNSHTETGLTSGDTLYFAMLSQNTIGTSGLSNEVSATAVPTQPGTLVASPKPSGGGIQTQWTASTGHDGYRILYRIGSHSLSDILASPTTINLSASSTSKNVTTVSINQLASIVLVAYNSGGESTYSNVVEEQPIPRSPDNLTGDVDVLPGKVKIEWERNEGVNNFNIYRMTGTTGTPSINGTLVGTTTGSVMEFTDSSFPSYGGTKYTYEIIAVGGGGSSQASSKLTVTPKDPAWRTVVYDGIDSITEVQVAGSPTGEAYVLATSYDHHHLFKYNEVAELQYEVTLTDGSNYPAGRAMELTFAPDGNLMALMRIEGRFAPSGLTSTGAYAYILAKINPADGSYIWNKLINPFTDAQWYTTMSTSYENISNGVLNGMLAEMVVDSTGASYVAWGSTGVSGYVKYDTNGNLVTTYDRVADTTGETLGKFASKPLVVVLPDDSFFWFQFVNKNSQDYLMGSKWASDGSVIFKNRTLDISHADYAVLPGTPTRANMSAHERHTGTAVADAVGNIFLSVNTTVGYLLKFNSEGTFISGTDDIIALEDEMTLATNGESIYAISSGSEQNSRGKLIKYSNSLVRETTKGSIGLQMKQDAYVDPSSCFVYVASVTRQGGAENYYLGNPTSPSSTQFSNNTVNSGAARKFLLYRVNNDLTLNAASSTCPSSSPTPTPVSPLVMAGNDTELLTRYYSGVNGYGEWTVATNDNRSLDVQHPEVNLTMDAYGANHQCRIIGSDLSCKGDNTVGQLGDGTKTTSSSFVTVDATSMGGVTAVSIGSDFTCALDNNSDAWCWGSGTRGRLGDKNTSNNNLANPNQTNTAAKFTSITSGEAHTCATTSSGQVWCWGDNAKGEQNDTVTSRKDPTQILGFSAATNPAQQIDAGKNFTCGIDNATTMYCWGTINNETTPYKTDTPFSTTATAVGAGDNHVCAALTNGNVQCWGDNSYNQAPSSINVYTLRSKAISIYAWDDYTCASLENGGYTCWGDGNIWVN